MSKLYFLFIVVFALILEATIISIPIVLDILLVFYIFKRRSRILLPAFFSGLALDIFRVRPLGLTAIFFIVFILLVFLYEKKFEIATYAFVFFAALLGGMAYLLVFGYNNIFWQGLASSIITVVMFRGLSAKFKAQKSKLQLKI